MSASLTEMIAAIVLAGVVFASALVPVTQMLVTYESTQQDSQVFMQHYLAGMRVQQLAAGTWRHDSPPPQHERPAAAKPTRFGVGDWTLRASSDGLEQVGPAGSGLLAAPLNDFTLEYRLPGGTWDSSLSDAQVTLMQAVRYVWRDAERTYRGVAAMSDRALDAFSVELPAETTPGGTYRRDDHERNVTVRVEAW